jgi:hypothetical protein
MTARNWDVITITPRFRRCSQVAGVRGGMTHGASDELGMHAIENPVLFKDLHATIPSALPIMSN